VTDDDIEPLYAFERRLRGGEIFYRLARVIGFRAANARESKPLYTPNKKTIREACAEIRSGWTEEERLARMTYSLELQSKDAE